MFGCGLMVDLNTLRRIVVPRLSHSMPPPFDRHCCRLIRVSAKKNVRMRDILTLSKKRVRLIIPQQEPELVQEMGPEFAE